MGLLGTHTVGAGKVRASHAGGYDAIDGIDLVAIADINQDKLSRFGKAWDIPEIDQYTDHIEMLETCDLDCVSIATPTYLHRDHTTDVCDHADPGVIWCEKPIASSVTEAEEMTATCNEHDIDLVINHSFRFTEKIVRLREHILNGLIGEVRSIHASFRMELMRNSTHLLDTLIYFLDAHPRLVNGYITGENEAVDALEATIDVDDAGGGGFLVTDDGAFVTIDCTLPRGISSMHYSIIGTAGKLYLNNDDGEWRYWTLEEDGHHEMPIPDIDGAWTWDDDYTEGFPNAAQHIVRLLDGDAVNRSPGEAATRSLAIIVAFFLSDYTGGTVQLPLERPFRDIRITSW